jgi:hypothetical protein
MVWDGLEDVLLSAIRDHRVRGELEGRLGINDFRAFFCPSRKALVPEEVRSDD